MQKELHSSCEEIFAERYRESESIRPGIIVNGFSAEDAWHCEMHKKSTDITCVKQNRFASYFYRYEYLLEWNLDHLQYILSVL